MSDLQSVVALANIVLPLVMFLLAIAYAFPVFDHDEIQKLRSEEPKKDKPNKQKSWHGHNFDC